MSPSLLRPFARLRVGVAAVFALLGFRLWHLQVSTGASYRQRAADNVIREINLPAPRGRIVDRKGHVLADNRPSFSVWLTPRFADFAALERLAEHLQLTALELAHLDAQVRSKRGVDRLAPIRIARHVDRDTMSRIEADSIVIPGVQIVDESERFYPAGEHLGHALGYMNQIGAAELAEKKSDGYRMGDVVGRAGIERQWESTLRGRDGFMLEVVDAKGQKRDDVPLERLTDRPRRSDPIPGATIVSTVDLDLQVEVESALAKHRAGAAVVVEVETGRILAIASQPSIDPGLLSGGMTRNALMALSEDEDRPFVDKALKSSYFPGSTFKIVSTIAAWQDDLVDRDERVQCKGSLHFGERNFRCAETHGFVDLRQAIARSCNVYFYRLGDRLGLDRIARAATQLGFGEPSGIGMGETSGFVPDTEYYRTHGGYQRGYALNTAIGQGSVQASVLQLAMAYAAIANGGRLMLPRIVDRIEKPDGSVVEQLPPVVRRQIAVEPAALDLIRRAMKDVVDDPKGTAYAARVADLSVAGKTGTAQVQKNFRGERREGDLANDHAWFASFAPADHPEIAVVVLVEHGGFGAKAATPTAMEIYRAYFSRLAVGGGSGARVKGAP